MNRALFILALIIALAGCAAAPQLRNVSVEADISAQVGGEFHYYWRGKDYRGGRVGRVEVVLDQPLTSELSYRVGLEHRSLLEAGDRGEERASVGFVFRPFGGSR